MTKKKEEVTVPDFVKEAVADKTPELVSPAPPNFTAWSFGITKDPVTGFWHVVKIPYNFATKEVGTPEQIGHGDDRSIAIERFKIEAGTSLMGDL